MRKQKLTAISVAGFALVAIGAGGLAASLGGNDDDGFIAGTNMPVPGSNVDETLVGAVDGGVSSKMPAPGFEGSVDEMVVGSGS